MVKQSKQRIFSCPECGTPYVAFPPDDLHDTAAVKEPSKNDAWDVIKIIHDCEKCLTPITIYWYQRKASFAVG
jgi:hypothetical protein